MSQREEHERYLLNAILSHSLSSENPSEETKRKAYKNSPSYFNSYKEELMEKYHDFSFDDFKGSEVLETPSGEVLKITQKEKFDFKLKENNYRNSLKSNLKLMKNVGPSTEEKLKREGFNCLDDLTDHKTYSKRSLECLKIIDEANFSDLLSYVKKNRYSTQCKKDILKSASLLEHENFKFMDIETLGLSNVPIILIGVAEIDKGKIKTTQYLIRNPEEEAAAIEGYFSHLDENSVHVTFNGKFFDVPFIKNRADYWGLESQKLDLPHFDLLYFARYLWRDELPNCKLQTIEKHKFNLEREGDVPGQFIPQYYDSYLEQKNVGPLVPIVEHNKQDIISLASFLMKMYKTVNKK